MIHPIPASDSYEILGAVDPNTETQKLRKSMYDFDNIVKEIITDENVVYSIKINWNRGGRVPDYVIDKWCVGVGNAIFDLFVASGNPNPPENLPSLGVILVLIRSIVKYTLNTWGLWYNDGWTKSDIDNSSIIGQCGTTTNYYTPLVNAMFGFGDCREHALLSAFLFSVFKNKILTLDKDHPIKDYCVKVVYTIVWYKRADTENYAVNNIIDYDHVFNCITRDEELVCFYDQLNVATEIPETEQKNMSASIFHLFSDFKNIKFLDQARVVAQLQNDTIKSNLGSPKNIPQMTTEDTVKKMLEYEEKLKKQFVIMYIPAFKCKYEKLIVSIVDFWEATKPKRVAINPEKINAKNNLNYVCGSIMGVIPGNMKSEEFAQKIFSFSFYKYKCDIFQQNFGNPSKLYDDKNHLVPTFLDMFVRQWTQFIEEVSPNSHYDSQIKKDATDFPSGMIRTFVSQTGKNIEFIGSTFKKCIESDPFVQTTITGGNNMYAHKYHLIKHAYEYLVK